MKRLPSLDLALHGDENSVPGRTRRESYSTPVNGRVSALGKDLGALQELLEGHWSDYK